MKDGDSQPKWNLNTVGVKAKEKTMTQFLSGISNSMPLMTQLQETYWMLLSNILCWVSLLVLIYGQNCLMCKYDWSLTGKCHRDAASKAAQSYGTVCGLTFVEFGLAWTVFFVFRVWKHPKTRNTVTTALPVSIDMTGPDCAMASDKAALIEWNSEGYYWINTNCLLLLQPHLGKRGLPNTSPGIHG